MDDVHVEDMTDTHDKINMCKKIYEKSTKKYRILIQLERARPVLITHKNWYLEIDVVVVRVPPRYGCCSALYAQVSSSNDNFIYAMRKKFTIKTHFVIKRKIPVWIISTNTKWMRLSSYFDWRRKLIIQEIINTKNIMQNLRSKNKNAIKSEIIIRVF